MDTPATLTLSKLVCPSTSKSLTILTTPLIVEIPDPLPPEAVIVTAPPDIAETSKFVPKLIVPAVPTVEPSCLITTPDPDAVIPVSPEPSPTNVVAVTTPAMLTLSKFV